MSEYSDAKLIILPNEGAKAGTMFVVKPTDGTGDGVMDRNGEKTRTNKEGLIETVAANLLLPDYSGGGCGVIKPEPQATQLYELTDVMSTQTKTTTANDYVVSFYGTGTITFSGTHTGSLVGTGVNDRVEVTFLASAGSLTSTISGSVTKGQLQLGKDADSYITNTGVGTVTRLKDNTAFTPPIGTTEIIETIDNIEQPPITVIPAIYELPVYNLGGELVVNGGFDTDTDWIKGAGWTISGNSLNGATTSLPTYQDLGQDYESGKTYKVSFEITNISSGSIEIEIGGDTNGTPLVNTNGTHQFLLTPTVSVPTRTTVRGVGAFIGSIDNVSVKEILSPGPNINKVIMT